jgi:hypothetical protein
MNGIVQGQLQTTHYWLEVLRERPGMYLGSPKLSLLRSFMDGLRLGQCRDIDPPYRGFICWLESRGIPTTMPLHWLVSKLGDEAAFSRFYELWDEYRQCSRVYLLRALVQDHHKANFQSLGPGGEFGPPQRALELIISQFAPSDAYAVTEVYLDHFCGEWTFFPTVERAKKAMRDRWDIRAEEWQPVSEQCKPRRADSVVNLPRPE